MAAFAVENAASRSLAVPSIRTLLLALVAASQIGEFVRQTLTEARQHFSRATLGFALAAKP